MSQGNPSFKSVSETNHRKDSDSLIINEVAFKNLSSAEIILMISNDIDTYSSLQAQSQRRLTSMTLETYSRSTTKQPPSGCSCKKTKCLKLYCQCFSSGGYCKDTCNCLECANNPRSQLQRSQAIISALQRQPNAFLISSQQSLKQHKGCTCKKSFCQKKYCQCFSKGVACTKACKCSGCRNPKLAINCSHNQSITLQI